MGSDSCVVGDCCATSMQRMRSGIFSMRFSGDLRVLWSTPIPQGVEISTHTPITLISLSGREQSLQPVNGKIVLQLSAQPLYIQGNISGISWHFL